MSQLNDVSERMAILSPTVQTNKERECKLEDFNILDALGQGAFGKVYKVEHNITKEVYAIKQMSKSYLKRNYMSTQINNEIKIMYGLNHPHIIKLLNHFEEEDCIYLILEFASGGHLWNRLLEEGRFPEATAQEYMRDMFSAIEYCHTRNPPILHRDIKPENILLDSNNQLKLADFGWSNFFDDGQVRSTFAGTPDYLAPEMIEESGHDLTLDYWTLGVLTYELLTGEAPFAPPKSVNNRFEAERIREQNILAVKISYPTDFPPMAKDFLSRILKRNPKDRIGIKQILDHPWLKLTPTRQSTKHSIKPRVSTRPSVRSSISRPNATINHRQSQVVSLRAKPSIKKVEETAELSDAVLTQISEQGTENFDESSYFDEFSVAGRISESGGEDADIGKGMTRKTQKMDSMLSEDTPRRMSNIPHAEVTWTEEELAEYSTRKESIINKPEVEIVSPSIKSKRGIVSQSEDIIRQFSIQYNHGDNSEQSIVDKLNKVISDLKKEVSEYEVKTKLQEREIRSLKSDNDAFRKDRNVNETTNTVDNKRIKLLEDQIQRLKSEINEIWETVENKETELQKKNLELKKLQDVKSSAEKYKIEKSSMSQQMKDLHDKLNQANGKILQLQQDRDQDKYKFERMLRESEVKNPAEPMSGQDQKMLRDLVEFAKQSMQEMQTKIDYYKEKSDSIEKLEKELEEKRILVMRFETDSQEKINRIKRETQESYEDKILKLKQTHKEELEKLESSYKKIIENLEADVKNYKKLQDEKDREYNEIEDYKFEINKLKKSNDAMNDFNINLQIMKEANGKMINQLQNDLEDLRIKNRSLEKMNRRAV